jgi:CcmD family protein
MDYEYTGTNPDNRRKTYMKLLTLLLTFLMAFAAGPLFAQSDVEMADTMRSNGKIYVVVAVLCLIFTGIAIYLLLIDRKLGKLEKQIQEGRQE